MNPRGRPKGESCATPPWASPIALSRGKPLGIYLTGYFVNARIQLHNILWSFNMTSLIR